MTWRVRISDRAEKDLARLDADLQNRVAEAIDRWSTGAPADYRRLKGRAGEGAIRVGEWRIMVSVDKRAATATVLRIRPRGGAYRP